MTPAEAADAVIHEFGGWMVSELGRDGLGDLVWDVHPEYAEMSLAEREAFTAAVAEELFA